MSGAAPAIGIAGILVAPSSRARPSCAVPPGSVAELSCQKIIFDLQLADLPVQKVDLRFIGGSLRRCAALEDAHRTIEQLLLPVVDLVRVHPEIHRQLGDGTVAPDCRHRHLRLERRTVLLPCPLHVLLPRYPRFLGAGLPLATCLIFGVQLKMPILASTAHSPPLQRQAPEWSLVPFDAKSYIGRAHLPSSAILTAPPRSFNIWPTN